MNEAVLASFLPARRSIPLRAVRPVAWAVGLGVALSLLARFNHPLTLALARWGPPACAILGGLALGWQVLVRQSRQYSITSRRLIAWRGVIRRTMVEIPLDRVEQIVIDRTLGERLLGLGTVCVTSAGSQTIDLAWVMIADPQAAVDRVRHASSLAAPRTLVLGLAGGIGSGKSAVAAHLASMGFILLDSDKAAKEALDRSDVRAELVKWWGTRVLTPQGRVDRHAVAQIIFSDPEQRQRLEALVHPIVKADRATLLAHARRQGAPGVVIDAPLLFEAGSDADCDYVLFVDAPEPLRQQRVQQTRGWGPDELARREIAQLPLEDKRQRSDVTILNDADQASLAARVQDALEHLRTRRPRRATAFPET
jgi:dephospho-CoA kinase